MGLNLNGDLVAKPSEARGYGEGGGFPNSWRLGNYYQNNPF